MGEFVRVYDRANWPNILRAELPGLTDTDIDWLSSSSPAMEPLEPPVAPAPGPAKTAAGRNRSSKRLTPGQTRRSPRFSGAPDANPTMARRR